MGDFEGTGIGTAGAITGRTGGDGAAICAGGLTGLAFAVFMCDKKGMRLINNRMTAHSQPFLYSYLWVAVVGKMETQVPHVLEEAACRKGTVATQSTILSSTLSEYKLTVVFPFDLALLYEN